MHPTKINSDLHKDKSYHEIMKYNIVCIQNMRVHFNKFSLIDNGNSVPRFT